MFDVPPIEHQLTEKNYRLVQKILPDKQETLKKVTVASTKRLSSVTTETPKTVIFSTISSVNTVAATESSSTTSRRLVTMPSFKATSTPPTTTTVKISSETWKKPTTKISRTMKSSPTQMTSQSTVSVKKNSKITKQQKLQKNLKTTYNTGKTVPEEIHDVKEQKWSKIKPDASKKYLNHNAVQHHFSTTYSMLPKSSTSLTNVSLIPFFAFVVIFMFVYS